MWIGGHAQVGWFVAWALGLDRRDRTLAAIAGMLPDVDAITRLGGVDAYLEGHHTYTHNLAAAVLFPLLLVGFARRRFWIYPVGVVAILLHFLSDGFGLLPLRPLWPSSRLMWWPNGGRLEIAAVSEIVVPVLLIWLQVVLYRRSRTSVLEVWPWFERWLGRRWAGR